MLHTVEQAQSVIQKHLNEFPQTMVVLGSGWSSVLDALSIETEIGFEELFGVKASVPGHEGKLVIGSIGKNRIAFLSGRLHTYEGYSSFEATLPIRLFGALGGKQLILTAACGALNPKYQVGDFVILSDMLTLFLALDNPLKGPQFVDLSEVFSTRLRETAKEQALKNKLSFHEGVYAYYHGPNYETPHDKMALRFLGADVVGMSIVHEAIVARSFGIETLGISFVTNLAFVKHDHTEVLTTAKKAHKQMKELILPILKTLQKNAS